MRTIETTVHVGSDGVLRLDMPVGHLGHRDQDLNVLLVIQPHVPDAGAIVWPEPGSWNHALPDPIDVGDPPASQTLVEDRR